MIASPHEPVPLSSLRAFGRALASNPNDTLIGFLQPASRADQPVVLSDRNFSGAILYALTRSNGTITALTFQLLGATTGEGSITLRDDGDWQMSPLILDTGTTTLLVTAHTADGHRAQAQISIHVPAMS